MLARTRHFPFPFLLKDWKILLECVSVYTQSVGSDINLALTNCFPKAEPSF